MKYNPSIIEKKWQKIWHDNDIFKAEIDYKKPKYYVLEMFPYPSGAIHMGHVRNYTLGDLVARYKRANGFNVLHPMGWDAFGLPAENAAIENKVHPSKWTYTNIESMKKQLKEMGLSYDWSREIATCDPNYFKFEQKMFIDFFNSGIAYKKETWVNWDPVENTVLANEQVIDGCGWRSGVAVEKKKMKGWFLNISNFASEILKDTDDLTLWPDRVKTMQKNWIGESHGATIKFKISHQDDSIDVFTTRPDTIFGATFLAISPNHPLAIKIAKDEKEVLKFINFCEKQSTSEIEIEKGEKFGYKTSITVDHPLINEKKIPVFLANFVLMEYGTGAIFGCPAHDQRDFDFATKYDIPIIQVLRSESEDSQYDELPYLSEGTHFNSRFLDGLDTDEAIKLSIQKLKDIGKGEGTTTYKIRDWGVSRQRYWGCPIPIIFCPKCGEVPVPIDQLPVTLPEDISLNDKGNPLDNHPTWKYTSCPKCKKQSIRETDTFDTFFESSWYFARFTDPSFSEPFSKEAADYWLPVDQYIGGIEHAVMHLLYSRFFMRALKAVNSINIKEPFLALETQGMVCHQTFKSIEDQWLFPKEVIKKDNKYSHLKTNENVIVGRTEKMSKSKKNVVDPNNIINNYGADTARFFMLSDSPPDRDMEWTDSGVDGSWRFLNKVWRFVEGFEYRNPELKLPTKLSNNQNDLMRYFNITVRDVTESIDNFHFNNAVASIRSLFNRISSFKKIENNDDIVILYVLNNLLILINPMVPHIAEELWEILGNQGMICNQEWPIIDTQYLQKNNIQVPVQVNGKMRAIIHVPNNTSKKELETLALMEPNVKKFLHGTPKKVIIVANRVVNFVN